MLRGTLCHTSMNTVSGRNVCVCMFETTCTGWQPQDHGDRKAWCLERCRKSSQPWSSFWETTAAARIILSSCLHKRDLFYKHPVISWTHVCGHSRSELHHWSGGSIFWLAFLLSSSRLFLPWMFWVWGPYSFLSWLSRLSLRPLPRVPPWLADH